MKSLTYITIIAALAFGFSPSEANAEKNTSDNTLETGIEGRVGVAYNDASGVLTLRIVAAQKRDRVLVTVANGAGKAVFQEKVAVDTRGVMLEYSLDGYDGGIYSVTVQGEQFDFRDKFKKK